MIDEQEFMPKGDSPSQPPGRGRRPFGLKAIVFLLILQVLAGFLVMGLYWLVNSDLSTNLELDWPYELTSALDDTNTVLYIFALQPILIVLRLVALVGLWRLRRWAWFLTMFLLAYAMASDAAAFFRGEAVYAFMFLNVLTVFYLNLSEVQNLFIVPKQKIGGVP